MSDRDKKLGMLLCVLLPCLLLAIWYGHSTMQGVEERKAEQRRLAQGGNEEHAQSNRAAVEPPSSTAETTSRPMSGRSSTSRTSPPASAGTAELRDAGFRVRADTLAQNTRMELDWKRDPFAPPDTLGPDIDTPEDLKSPRGAEIVELDVYISDETTGNSGTKSAFLVYSYGPHSEPKTVQGERPATPTGDGIWKFAVPAPEDSPLSCYIVAQDDSLLRNTARSKPFDITPESPDEVAADTDGSPVKLVLRGISFAETNSVALINDEIVARDEFIHGYRIVEIAKNAVVLERNGQQLVLELKE